MMRYSITDIDTLETTVCYSYVDFIRLQAQIHQQGIRYITSITHDRFEDHPVAAIPDEGLYPGD